MKINYFGYLFFLISSLSYGLNASPINPSVDMGNMAQSGTYIKLVRMCVFGIYTGQYTVTFIPGTPSSSAITTQQGASLPMTLSWHRKSGDPWIPLVPNVASQPFNNSCAGTGSCSNAELQISIPVSNIAQAGSYLSNSKLYFNTFGTTRKC